MHLRVKVVPGASRSEIAGWLGDELKVRVAAPPEGGRANRAVIELIATRLGIPRQQIELVGGASSPHKTLAVAGLDEATVLQRLGEN